LLVLDRPDDRQTTALFHKKRVKRFENSSLNKTTVKEKNPSVKRTHKKVAQEKWGKSLLQGSTTVSETFGEG
jgi:hypothetical protein